MLPVGEFEHSQDTRRAHRAAAHYGLPEGQRRAVRIQEERRCGRGRGGLASVVADQPVRGRIVMEHEGAATDARGLRLHERQHQLHRDRRIDRAAARREHFDACRDRQRIGGSNHVAGGEADLPRLPAGGMLGCNEGRRQARPASAAGDHQARRRASAAVPSLELAMAVRGGCRSSLRVGAAAMRTAARRRCSRRCAARPGEPFARAWSCRTPTARPFASGGALGKHQPRASDHGGLSAIALLPDRVHPDDMLKRRR